MKEVSDGAHLIASVKPFQTLGPEYEMHACFNGLIENQNFASKYSLIDDVSDCILVMRGGHDGYFSLGFDDGLSHGLVYTALVHVRRRLQARVDRILIAQLCSSRTLLKTHKKRW